MASSLKKCYYPDGSLSHDVPCDLTAEASTCCAYGFACTTNHLCLNGTEKPTEGMYMRASCTDRTWRSEACSQHCKDGNPGGSEAVVYFNNGIFACAAEGSYSKVGGCANSTVLALGTPSVYTIAGVLVAVTSSSSSSVSSPVVSTTSSITSTTAQGKMPLTTVRPSSTTSAGSIPSVTGDAWAAMPGGQEGAQRKMLGVRGGVAAAVVGTCVLVTLVVGLVLWIRQMRLKRDRELLRRGAVGLEMPQLKTARRGRHEEAGLRG